MKLLLVGLDGLSFSAFEEYDMPFLQAMSEQGVRAKHVTLGDPYTGTGPVGASIQTGLPPAEHGVMERKVETWQTLALKPNVKTIWRMLNEKGVRCGLVNFPLTYPMDPLEGFVVCGFPAPWEHKGAVNPWANVDLGGPLFWPEEIGRHIGTFRSAWMYYVRPEEFADTHVPHRRAVAGDPEALRYMMAKLYRSLHETARLTFRLMREYPVDLLAAVLVEPDTIGHLGPALGRDRRNAFLREVDDTVREMFVEADPENMVVLSDHGCWVTHEREAVFLAAGPAFASGRGGSIDVLEVAPTILYLWGAYEVRLPREPAHRFLASGQVDESEKQKVSERLRAMGYSE